MTAETKCGGACPFEKHAPQTIDGEAAWQAAGASITGDMAGARIDLGAAVPAAIAMGCAPECAAQLVAAVQAGLQAAQEKRRGGDVG